MAKIIKPIGARLVVDPVESEVSLVQRGAKVGLKVIVKDENKPKSTYGKVIAIGTDPIFADVGIKEGDTVHYRWHAGAEFFVADKEYRILEWQEVTLLETEDLSPAQPSPSQSLSHTTDQPEPEYQPKE